jgi:hypothetical protein
VDGSSTLQKQYPHQDQSISVSQFGTRSKYKHHPENKQFETTNMKFFTATVLFLLGSASAFSPLPLSNRATSSAWNINPNVETEIKKK